MMDVDPEFTFSSVSVCFKPTNQRPSCRNIGMFGGPMFGRENRPAECWILRFGAEVTGASLM